MAGGLTYLMKILLYSRREGGDSGVQNEEAAPAAGYRAMAPTAQGCTSSTGVYHI